MAKLPPPAIISLLIFYILGYLIAPPTVIAKLVVPNIHKLCQERGYSGACERQNRILGELGCLNLVCARKIYGYYIATDTGMANDWTICASDKVCSKGVCVSVHPEQMPIAAKRRTRYSCRTPIVRKLITTNNGV